MWYGNTECVIRHLELLVISRIQVGHNRGLAYPTINKTITNNNQLVFAVKPNVLKVWANIRLLYHPSVL